MNNRIRQEEDGKANISAQASKMRAEIDKIKNESKELENTLIQCEDDKQTKGNQITTLKEELQQQDDLLNKLQKEKKSIGDSKQRTEEEIQALEDRCNHLSKVKGKLEQSLDECEDSLEREKKAKGDVDKIKRRLEGDVKLTQEAVADLERVVSELSSTVQRKDKELGSVCAKIEDEQTLGGKFTKQVKELHSRIEELDEELAIERQNRAKAEKSRSALSRDIEDLAEKLEDAGNNTATQVELNKKREAELMKLKNDLEESNIAHESTLASLRQKHNSAMGDLGDQIDQLNKMKARIEMEKGNMERDLMETRTSLDDALRERANLEKASKLNQSLIVDSNQKIDELARALNEADSSRKKLSVEQQDLQRQTEETENGIAALGKSKISLTTQLEDTR